MTFWKYARLAAKQVWKDSFKKARAIGFFVPMTIAITALFFPSVATFPTWWLPLMVLGLFIVFNLIIVPYEMVREREQIIAQHNDRQAKVVGAQASLGSLAALHGTGRDIRDRPVPSAGDWNNEYDRLTKDYAKWIADVRSRLNAHETASFDDIIVPWHGQTLPPSEMAWEQITEPTTRRLLILADICDRRQRSLGALQLAIMNRANTK